MTGDRVSSIWLAAMFATPSAQIYSRAGDRMRLLYQVTDEHFSAAMIRIVPGESISADWLGRLAGETLAFAGPPMRWRDGVLLLEVVIERDLESAPLIAESMRDHRI